jgi:hypothetical protein
MAEIDAATSLEELAVIISGALEAAGIIATLSGGGAVAIYSENQYVSRDLDFVTSADATNLQEIMAPLGFVQSASRRLFEHPLTEWLVEFPAGPLGFGSRVMDHNAIPLLETACGFLRIITPSLCVIDRLAAYLHWNDRQCWDQAVLVCRSHPVDWEDMATWARSEGLDVQVIDRLRAIASSPP